MSFDVVGPSLLDLPIVIDQAAISTLVLCAAHKLTTMSKPVSNSRASATKTVYAAFQLLKENGGTMALKDILESIPKRVQLNEWELLIYEKTGYVRWGSIFHFYSLDCAKAGFLVKNNGIWTLTPEGEKAMSKGADSLMEAAITAYKKWAKENKKSKPELLDKEDVPLEMSSEINIELMESRARESIVEHIRHKNPYEFQDLVAALLRAMGYHTPVVAPRGADGGVDIIAYQDPLGMTPPRVKVQVKHKPDANVPPTDVRALIGVSNRPGEAGLFVTSGKFSNDATREARTSNTHCELIDLDRFIELWREFYTKMPDEDRARLPLHAVWFLGAVE